MSTRHSLETWASLSFQHNSVDLIFHERREIGHFVADPLVFRAVDENALVSVPSLRLRKDEAQALMDELWRVGLRPSEGTGSAGSLAATERHLADMRLLVLHPLGLLNGAGVVR